MGGLFPRASHEGEQRTEATLVGEGLDNLEVDVAAERPVPARRSP
jgi:hypothetical protein